MTADELMKLSALLIQLAQDQPPSRRLQPPIIESSRLLDPEAHIRVIGMAMMGEGPFECAHPVSIKTPSPWPPEGVPGRIISSIHVAPDPVGDTPFEVTLTLDRVDANDQIVVANAAQPIAGGACVVKTLTAPTTDPTGKTIRGSFKLPRGRYDVYVGREDAAACADWAVVNGAIVVK